MSSVFVYQPHVHTESGVLSPDLAIDRLLLAQPHGEPLTLPRQLLTSAPQLEQLGESACAAAALVLVAAGRGTLLTIGSAHWDPTLSGALAHAVAAKPVAREARRLADCAGLLDWQLTTERVTAAGVERVAQSRIGELAGAEAAISRWSDDAPRGAMLFVSSAHRDTRAAAATGYSVALADPRGRRALAFGYGIVRL